MKNAFYFLSLTFLFSISIGSASATVFRVNNGLTENIPNGLFNQLKTAHDDFKVKNGDTLMVEGSGSAKPYEGFTCTKRLVIIGPGYFLGENAGVNSVAASASVNGTITFDKGSQGSYLIGMELTYNLYVYTSNIYCIRSKVASIYFANDAANCKVTSSYINRISAYHPGNNISVTSCIIQSDYSDIAYATYDNNVLSSDGGSDTWKFSSGTFRNNILIDRDDKVEIKSPNFQNNLALNAQFGTDNGNQGNYEPSDLFIGGTSSDGKYQIKATSKFIKAGYNGTQPGIFGGSEPYTLSGVPPIPIIYDLNVPGTGSAASGLNINVKIRGAN
ncbi:hypothetical protein GO730_13620 [Spirosoma sp. HMF3257]|uniref:Right-handed parallel beta-helix repeat-containing protein n=1 Tax=Spirosoma telluris TaxID=2183553 RepID=A0A327NLQ0_9BACT|nr:hypothetical protein [Spirosoma telluris]RAI74996.1 hypothetical protein HMF3257_13540 [Spirosoma telluris]